MREIENALQRGNEISPEKSEQNPTREKSETAKEANNVFVKEAETARLFTEVNIKEEQHY